MSKTDAPETSGKSFIGLVIFLVIFVCMVFAGGYVIGTKYPAGNLRRPVQDRLYKLKLVAVPKSNKAGGNYEFEKHFKDQARLMNETGLDQIIIALDNGIFRLVNFEK